MRLWVRVVARVRLARQTGVVRPKGVGARAKDIYAAAGAVRVAHNGAKTTVSADGGLNVGAAK